MTAAEVQTAMLKMLVRHQYTALALAHPHIPRGESILTNALLVIERERWATVTGNGWGAMYTLTETGRAELQRREAE